MFRFILFAQALLFCLAVSAQSEGDELRKNYLELSDSGRFQDAIDVLDDLIKFWDAEASIDSSTYYRYRRVHTLGLARQYDNCIGTGLELINELESKESLPSFMGGLYFSVGGNSPYLGEMGQALELLNKSIQFEKNNPTMDTLVLAKATEWKGLTNLFIGNIDLARDFVEEALEIRYTCLDSSNKEIGYNLNSLASVYNDLGMKRKAQKAYDEALRIMQLHLPPNHPHISSVASNLSIVLSDLGEVNSSMDLMKDAIQRHQASGSYYELMNEYYNLASIYMDIQEYDNALLFMRKSQELSDSLRPEFSADKAILYDGFGAVYYMTNDFEKADSMFYLSLEQRESLEDKNYIDIAQSIFNLGLMAQERNEFERAYNFYRRSGELRTEYLGETHPKTANSIFGMAEMLWESGAQEEALEQFKKCIDLYEASVTRRNQWTLEAFVKTAEAYLEIGELDSSRHYLAEAYEGVFNLLPGSFEYGKLGSYQFDYYESYILTLIEFHFKLLIEESNNGIQNPTELADLMKTMDKAMVKLRPLVNLEQSANPLFNQVKTIYQKGALLALTFNEPGILETHLLHAAGQSKSLSIKSALQNREAMSFASVPDSILEKDREIREKLKFIQAQLKDDEDSYWSEVLFETVNEWNAYQDKLRRDFPEWYALRYAEAYTDADKIATELKKRDASLLVFMKVETGFIAMVKNSDSFNMVNLSSASAIDDSVRTYRKLVETLAPAERLGPLSYYLYKALWKPLQSHLKSTVLLIPDGALHFLNFETLVTELPQSQNFSEWKWLLADHEIILRNTLPHNEEQEKKGSEVLTLSPGFDDELKASYLAKVDSSGHDSVFTRWLQTPWSLDFSEELGHRFGVALTREEANEERFQQHAAEAGILHFGTHAILSDKEPLLSFLALTPKPELGDDGYLYAYELYNQPLKASMAVLTACETGLGTYREGDGVVSLAYAFQYAGCPNVVYSLWQIDDKQSTLLVEKFYEYLYDGDRFASALRLAKLDYIAENSGELSAPYYWGGVVITGEDGTVAMGRSWTRYALLIVFALAVSVGLLLFIRSRQNV